MADKKPQIEETKVMRVVWDDNEDVGLKYANHIYVSHGGGKEFHIYFGHLSPPITKGKKPDEYAETLNIKTVSKIVVSPTVMKEITEVLNKNLEKFEKISESDKEDLK